VSATNPGRSRARASSWSRFAAAFESDLEQLTDHLVCRIVGELPSFSQMRPADLHLLACEGMSVLDRAIQEHRPVAAH